jgi:DNA helicase IV
MQENAEVVCCYRIRTHRRAFGEIEDTLKTLISVKPTPEQLPIIQNNKPGVTLIRGAAGSGKTSTAILRIKQLVGFWLTRRTRLQIDDPIRLLVITFNRTLRGYIADLANQQLAGKENLDLMVSTFANWAQTRLPNRKIIDDIARQAKLKELCHPLPIDTQFLVGEVDYLLGRFPADQLQSYLPCSRDGRGAVPRVDRALRARILAEVVSAYIDWKQSQGKADWNDLANEIVKQPADTSYDIIVADESQDLSANEVRALLHCKADPSSVTFVLDAAQRIYPRGFAWREVGVDIQPSNSYRLKTNHRNTIEICKFAFPLLRGLDVGDDGTFPDFTSCQRTGPKPLVLKGKYSKQAEFAIRYIQKNVDLETESVAFLKPKGGQWFGEIRKMLSARGCPYVELTRLADWPTGSQNIATSTMNSAKGLEFDHVIILGLNAEVTEHQSDPKDESLDNLRRLLAMAITRARTSVLLGYKPSEASDLIEYLEPRTFEEVTL